VRVHDIDAKRELFKFDHPVNRQPSAIAISAGRTTLYVGGQGGKILAWDILTGRQQPDIGRHGTAELRALTRNPAGSNLYSAGQDRMVRRWDLKAGKELPFPDGYVGDTAIALTPDGKHIVIADHTGRIDFWDLTSGKLAKQLQGPAHEAITSLAVSNDGRWLACGRVAPEVQLWDLTTGKAERVIRLVE